MIQFSKNPNIRKPVITSAPGKLMLLGEHAVVYGYPCIVMAINKWMKVAVERIDHASVDLNGISDTRFIKAAIGVFRSEFDVQVKGVKITTESEFGGISGLGSSAATTVATMKALSLFCKKQLTDRELFELSYKVVLQVQGVGSGFDVAASVYGGVLYYKQNGRNIEKLSVDNLPLLVFYTGAKAHTAEIVQEVGKINSTKRTQIFDHIGELVEQGKNHLLHNEWQKLGKIMNQNQKLLQELSVSSVKIDKLVSVAQNAGAFGAKLSGAGRGDCVVVLAPKEKRGDIISAVEKVGGEYIDISVT